MVHPRIPREQRRRDFRVNPNQFKPIGRSSPDSFRPLPADWAPRPAIRGVDVYLRAGVPTHHVGTPARLRTRATVPSPSKSLKVLLRRLDLGRFLNTGAPKSTLRRSSTPGGAVLDFRFQVLYSGSLVNTDLNALSTYAGPDTPHAPHHAEGIYEYARTL